MVSVGEQNLNEGIKGPLKREISKKDSKRKIPINQISDIDPRRWKEYESIITDSLWIFKRRDSKVPNSGDYWGNFVPQIPQQLLLRYTREGDWVLDPFAGSGTTLVECALRKRNALGIDISPEAAQYAGSILERINYEKSLHIKYINGDSSSLNYGTLLSNFGIKSVQLVILHPPYWDIVKFSKNNADLSNAESLDVFLDKLMIVVRKCKDILDYGRHIALVIGDKYSSGHWIPLGFYSMDRVMKLGLTLKSIVVKNFEETRGKSRQRALWRYRALIGGYYVFKHEYIFIFQKTDG